MADTRMQSLVKRASFLTALVFVFACTPQAYAQSNEDIKKQIIRESIATYPGNCPCPYNVDRGGRRCGGRSAYTRPGGYSPLCYPQDVTDQMIDTYKARTQKQNR